MAGIEASIALPPVGWARLRSGPLNPATDLERRAANSVQNQRNLILAILLTILLIFGWDSAMRYMYPEANKPQNNAAGPAATQQAAPGADPARADKPTREGGLSNPADVALEARDLATALN